jgi:hypothetical protein
LLVVTTLPVDFPSTDADLLAVLSVLNADALLLTDVFEILDRDQTVLVVLPIAAMRDDTDGLRFHEQLPEDVPTNEKFFGENSK